MIRFVNEYWGTVWDRDALVGDRVRGVVFLLLLASLFAFFIGGLASRTQAWGVKEVKSPDTDESATSPSVSARLARFIRAALVPFAPLAEYLPITAGASVILSLLVALLALDRELRWAAAAAAIPAFLVLLQYVYLWVHTPNVEHTATAGEIADAKGQKERAEKAVSSAYGPRTLFIRYGFPAIVLLIEGLVLVFTLVRPQGFLGLPRWEVAYGAQFGAMGAYAWVILELGRRSFRRDVTSGIAVWSIVTLAVGPMLAAVVALLWKPTPRASDGWQMAVVFFYAGYAPRTVLSAVTSAATQLLRVGPPPNIETRTTPLTKIRGINAQIEERLAEEGIDNVETLATVEPYRLHRDTSFDLGTIIWWIDEALLLMYVPQRWQLLEEQGITGAIDLADLESRVEPDPPNNADGGIVSPPSSPAAAVASLNPGASSLAGTPPVDAIDALANRINMTRPEFQALIRRVRADRHVNYIWWIYNANGSNGDSDPPLV